MLRIVRTVLGIDSAPQYIVSLRNDGDKIILLYLSL